MPSLLNSCLPGSFQRDKSEKENYFFGGGGDEKSMSILPSKAKADRDSGLP